VRGSHHRGKKDRNRRKKKEWTVKESREEWENLSASHSRRRSIKLDANTKKTRTPIRERGRKGSGEEKKEVKG